MAKEAAKLRATAEANRKANPPQKPPEAKPLTKEELQKAKEELKKVIEVRIRRTVAQLEGKRVDKLTKADLEKVTTLNLDSIINPSKVLTELDRSKVLTELKELEKLTQLRELFLLNNLELTKDKAQITELRNALPNCKVIFNRFN
tara:strand:+ start:262 stop:699 length:438 start_codon:yes stop_codon:yes gene_type:complete